MLTFPILRLLWKHGAGAAAGGIIILVVQPELSQYRQPKPSLALFYSQPKEYSLSGSLGSRRLLLARIHGPNAAFFT